MDEASKAPLAATLGGMAALASSIGVALTFVINPVIPSTALLWAVLVAGAAAGFLALVLPRRAEALIVADVLLSLAMTVWLLEPLALLYLPALLLLAVGTGRSRSRRELEPVVDETPAAPMQVRSISVEGDLLRRAG